MAGNDEKRFQGLASASLYGAFTTSRDAISILYDAMTVEWHNGGEAPERMPSASFAILASPAGRGAKVNLDLRGFSFPAGAGSIRLDVGGSETVVTATEEQAFARVEAVLSADADETRVTVTLDLPEPADESTASLALDSIDIAWAGCSDGREG